MFDDIKENTKLIGQSNELKSAINSVPLIKSLNDDNINKIKHFFIHQEDKLDHLQQFIKNIRIKWNQLISKQPKHLPIWIIFSIFILLSTILCYMIVLLSCHTPKHHNLSICAQELIIEKEIIQPDSPVKIKLTNI